jgi:5-methylthioadenosine/S-adenosylhomocysteine deaminase
MRVLLAVTLLLSSVRIAADDAYALLGTVMAPDRVLTHGVVVVRNGLIESVLDTPPAGIPAIDTGGIILPGMIDLHDHVTWNFQPRWQPPVLSRNRYDWQALPEYVEHISSVQYAIRDTLACDEELYGEIKALVHGATSINGSLNNPCAAGMVRNVDVSTGLSTTVAAYEVFPFELAPKRAMDLRDALTAKKYVVFFHLAEGIDASAARELKMLDKQDFLRDGVVLIHGTALRAADFKLLADRHVGIVWSPRSNEELYGTTTDVRSAKAMGVTIALAPDWSITGSDGMIDELAYAGRWNEQHATPFSKKELLAMTTSIPAGMANLGALGEISPGKRADLLIIDPEKDQTKDTDPYTVVTHTSAEHVRAVIVDGRPLTGIPSLVSAIAPSTHFESFDLCGVTRSIDLSDANNGKGATLSETSARLETALRRYSQHLSPLAACH